MVVAKTDEKFPVAWLMLACCVTPLSVISTWPVGMSAPLAMCPERVVEAVPYVIVGCASESNDTARRTTPLRAWKMYCPSTELPMLLWIRPVPRLLSRNDPLTPEPTSSKNVPGLPVPLENPARADDPPRPPEP